ncbi:MAG TPA: class I lanthipeptide [Thermoanaerobaculia bacterium]|nr:class I lanthipeptide [Thermoanaerobaculia bacterium]
MNKKKGVEKRKLKLCRETLLSLEETQLVQVNGGVTQICTEYHGGCTCNTRLTCSSALC